MSTPTEQASVVTSFIIYSQREFLLRLSERLSKGHISFAQFYLLSYLHSSLPHEITMGDIARKMGHSTAAASGLIDRMELLGYVKREHHHVDRRKVIVWITKEGVRLITSIRSELINHIDKAMSEVGPTEFIKEHA